MSDLSKSGKNYVIATYQYPYHLLPAYHTALYQLLVAVEQGHSQSNLDAACKRLRDLAGEAFVEYGQLVKADKP